MTLILMDTKKDNTDSDKQLKLLHQVLERLQADLLASDAQWTLFVATATSYRYESLLFILPKGFLTSSEGLNIDLICETIANVPRLELVMHQLMVGNIKCFSPQVVKLLHSVLVGHRDRVTLTTLRPWEFSNLYEHLKMPVPKNSPTQIYEVMASEKYPNAKAHAELRQKGEYPVRLGFYGGKLENLYSIIMTGSLPNGVEPLMLTTDIDEAFAMSTPGAGWGGSRCGSILRSIAVVEFIYNPTFVTAVAGNRHVLITDGSCMQISYLFVYGQSCNAYEKSIEKPCQSLFKWVDHNRFKLTMAVYLMGLSYVSRTGGSVFRSVVYTGFKFFKRNLLNP